MRKLRAGTYRQDEGPHGPARGRGREPDRGASPLDEQTAHVELLAKDEKAGHGALIPLRGDPAADLKDWLREKLAAFQEMARLTDKPLPLRLPADEPMFTVPRDFVKILDRDLAGAGIPKHDERGRTVDPHALRHTFGTHLSRNGVPPRAAQAALRHSSLDLTMLARPGENVYTDPSLLDVAGALEALPGLSVETPRQASLVKKVTRAETFWSFAHLAPRYRVTDTLGRDFFSCSTPASVTCVRQR